eukprot:GHRQ01027316.1.p1 GENE.GHRQ01027316.1~~GHRQ01027316.1.p1  ORF type:complete len:132 (-),score=36.30 GHRQ01027316.1:55-450(-)
MQEAPKCTRDLCSLLSNGSSVDGALQDDCHMSSEDMERCMRLLRCCVQGLKRPELRDELYMQLVKQTRGNPSSGSRSKAWGLFNLVSASMPPSKDFTGLISEYVHSAVQVRDMTGSLHAMRPSVKLTRAAA